MYPKVLDYNYLKLSYVRTVEIPQTAALLRLQVGIKCSVVGKKENEKLQSRQDLTKIVWGSNRRPLERFCVFIFPVLQNAEVVAYRQIVELTTFLARKSICPFPFINKQNFISTYSPQSFNKSNIVYHQIPNSHKFINGHPVPKINREIFYSSSYWVLNITWNYVH